MIGMDERKQLTEEQQATAFLEREQLWQWREEMLAALVSIDSSLKALLEK